VTRDKLKLNRIAVKERIVAAAAVSAGLPFIEHLYLFITITASSIKSTYAAACCSIQQLLVAVKTDPESDQS